MTISHPPLKCLSLQSAKEEGGVEARRWRLSIESFSQLPLVVVLRLQRISKYKDLPGLTNKNTTEILLTGCVTILHGTSDRLRDDTFVYKQTGAVPCNTGCLNLLWPFPVPVSCSFSRASGQFKLCSLRPMIYFTTNYKL